MYTLDELKKASQRQEKKKTAGPSKEDAIYQKYLESKKYQPKVSGGTVNPIITTADVRENRNLTKRESPTYTESLAKNRKTAAQLGKGLEKAKATVQDVKDILFSGRNYGTANPTFSLGKEYDSMTENEAGIYTSLVKQGKKDAANAYLKALQMDLNQRNAAQMQERAKQTAQKNALGGIGMDVAGAMSSGAGAAYSLWKEAKGEAIDPYHPAFAGTTMQAGAAEGLLGDSTGAKRLLKQAALATAEWGGQALGYGAFAPVAMAAGAAGSSMQDAAERGGTAEEAAFYGLTSGAAEMAAEKMGFDRYLGILDKIAPMKGNKTQIAKQILKEMGSEGLEEGATEIANILADMAIMGEKSNMNSIYQDAQAGGKSKGAAAWDAMKAAAGQVGESFAVGALSGGMIGGGLAGADIAAGKDPLARARAQYEAATKPAEVSYTSAKNVEKSMEKPVDKAVDNAIEPVEERDTAVDNIVKDVDKVVDKAEDAEAQSPEERFFSGLEEYGEKYYGEKGQAAYIKRAQETGTLDHTAAFNTYYRAGIAGITEQEIKPTAYTAVADKQMLNEAWMAGAEDRRTELANAIRGKSKISGERGLILGEDVKATEAQLALAGLYADIGGARIQLVEHIDAEEGYHINGMQEENLITIALDADSFSGALHHEMIHYIKRANPEGFDTLRELVFTLAQESGIDMDAQMEEYRSKYEEIYGEDAEMTAYMEEITADAFEKLAADEESLKSMVRTIQKKDPSLLDKIKDFLKRMAQTLESLLKDNTYTDFAEQISKDKENLEKLQNAFAWALTEAGKAETQMEEGGRKYSLNPNFPAQYDAWDGKSRTTFYIGTTSKALKSIGIQAKKIIWKSEKIKKILEKHSGMTDEIIKQVPQILENPIIVMKSLNAEGKGDSRITIFGEVEDANGVPVVAILELLPKSKEDAIIDIQILASAYGKTSNIKSFIEKSEVLYLDENKKRTDTWLQSVGLQLPSDTTKYGSIGSVAYAGESVNIQGVTYADLVGNGKKQEQTAVHSKKEISTEIVAPVSENSIAQDGEESNNKNITKYSVREEEYTLLMENREEFRQANEILQQVISEAAEGLIEEKQVKQILRQWKGKHGGTFDIEEYAERLSSLLRYAEEEKETADFGKIMTATCGLAEEMLQGSNKKNTLARDAFRSLWDKVKESKIQVTEEMKEALKQYGGYNAFRTEYFGRVQLSTKEGGDIRTLYDTLQKEYPDFFTETADATEMLLQIGAVMDILRPTIDNPYGYDIRRYSMDAAYELWDSLLNQISIEEEARESLSEKRTEFRRIMARIRENSEMEEERLLNGIILNTDERTITQQKEWTRTQRSYYVEKLHKKTAELERRRARQEFSHDKRIAENHAKTLLKWLKSPTNTRHVPQKYRDSLAALLVRLDSANKDITLLQRDMQRIADSMKEWKSLRGEDGIVAEHEYDENIVTLLENLAIAIGRSGGSIRMADMTNEQMRWLKQALASIRANMTKSNELLSREGSGEISAMSERFIQEAEGRKKAAQAKPLRVLGDFFGLDMLTPETFLKGVSEEIYNTFWKGLRDGLGRKTLREEAAMRYMEQIVSKKTARKWTTAPVRAHEIKRKDAEGKETSQKIYLTIPQTMYLYCALRREQAKKHMLLDYQKDGQPRPGGGIIISPDGRMHLKGRAEAKKALEQIAPIQLTESELRQITETLTEQQKKTALYMQQFLSTTAAEWGNEVSMRLYGYRRFEEKNYIPIQSSEEYIQTIYGEKNEKGGTLQNMGAAKNIEEYANNPIVVRDIFEIFAEHIDQMASYNAFVPVLRDMNRFLNYRVQPKAEQLLLTKQEEAEIKAYMTEEEKQHWAEIREMNGRDISEMEEETPTHTMQTPRGVRTSLKGLLGPKADAYFQKLMEGVNNAAGRDDTGILPKKMLRNMKAASVGANLRVMIQQPTSIVRAISEINPLYLIGAAPTRKADYERMYQYAPIALWKEWGGADMDTGRTLYERMTGQGLYQQITNASMAGAGWLDKVTWGRIWKACEMEAKQKHKNLEGEAFWKKVGERFTEIIDRTQVVDSVLHRSQMMRSKNFFLNMSTSFMSEPIKTYNMIYDSIRGVYRNPKDKKAWSGLITNSFVLTLNAITVSAAAAILDAARDDDEDEAFWEKWQKALMGDYSEAEGAADYIMAFWASNLNDNMNPMNLVPYLKDISSLIGGYDIARSDMSWVTDIINWSKKMMEFMEGESKYTLNGMLLYTAGAFSKMTGLPLKSFTRDIFAIKDSVITHTFKQDWAREALGMSEAEHQEIKYQNRKLQYALGSETNLADYTKRMLEAKFSGNDALATKIYNEMIAAGISNEKIDGRIETQEKGFIQEEAAAKEAIGAYHRQDFSTYTAKMDELQQKGYSRKGIEAALRQMYRTAYKEEDAEEFAEITADFWNTEEEMTKEKFQSLIDAIVTEKTGGRNSGATRLFNYMVDAGLDNDSIRSGINSAEKKAMKADPKIEEGAKAYHEGDVDTFLSVVDRFQEQHYFTENIYNAIQEMSEKLYGEDDPGTYETITDDYWKEDTDDTGADYGLLYNAWLNGSKETYNRMWDILEESGKKNSSIRSSMRSRLETAYEKAEKGGDTEKAKRIRKEFLRLGGKAETLEKE